MSDTVRNLFIHRSAAARYSAARPYFHPLVCERIAAFFDRPRFSRALDVACGTGQSSRALKLIADHVDATDISPEMIEAAEPDPQIAYRVAAAESHPFEDASFDLITVGLAFHWFDQPAFLREVRRLLRADGKLVVYTSGFTGEMVEAAAFREWSRGDYMERFPSPHRRALGLTSELVSPFGLEFLGEESFEHREVMTAAQLTNYLLTQTNTIAAIESGETPLEEAAGWIAEGIEPFFGGEVRTLRFAGSMWFVG